MNEQKLMVIDIDPTSGSKRKQQPLWTSSDNSFKFSFFQENTDTFNQASLSSEHTVSQFRFSKQEASAFAFDFQIDTEKDMDKETSDVSSHKQSTDFEIMQSGSSSNSSTSNTSKKKKKKTVTNKVIESNTKKEPIRDMVAEKQEGETAEVNTEEQLQRELDWCIEQLELGMRSHKASPKQKEEASRALKTLRSSKAPLVKKRQVMRAMAGDYRKKMQDEKSKQFKLIQNETASAQLRAVSELPKKSSFHRKAGIRTSPSENSYNSNNCDEQVASDFVFMPSNELLKSVVSSARMSELSDEASESEQLGASLSLWLGETLVRPEELDVPLDLHTACSIGQYDVVAESIKKGEVDLDRKNFGGWTPLMYAAYIGHDNIANLLLEAGVNVNATTAKGLSPLMLAASCGNESIAYFLLQQGAELEMKDVRGWTALFHCTSAGHQQMVKFLLDNNADANVKEPVSGFTPLMEAAASGHEIIVQYLLDHKVKIDHRNAKGETARVLAMMYGYTKIVSLIESRSQKIKPGHFEDLSSSEDSDSAPPRPRLSRTRSKGVSIHDGPQAIAKFRVGTHKPCETSTASYMEFRDIREQSEGICFRDVTSPINELDGQSNSSRDESPFFDNDMPTMRSSSSSSEGLPHMMGLKWEGSVESNEDSDQCKKTSSRRVNKASHVKAKNRHGGSNSAQISSTENSGSFSQSGPTPPYSGPKERHLDSLIGLPSNIILFNTHIFLFFFAGLGRFFGANWLLQISSIT
ncbi:hypothetical protein WMY93_011029 [Mugilogobius chulae]|uniref:Uncharacterized protein n=1 Tax=Mugilogobius chulae TaxID=88201 RepID=A0AAW0P9C6_9GOBI